MENMKYNILLLMLFILFFASVHSISSSSGCIETERIALLEFKASLGSESSSLSSWTGRDCCSWHGITCHNLTGYVLMLQLGSSQNYFNSSMSPWLFNLTHLEVFDLSSCVLRGPIPDMFDKLTSLIHLDLSMNSFDSAVIPDSLCNLTTLTHMDLSGTGLQGSLPFCLGNLTSLAQLSLASNELSGEIPGWLGNLTLLNTLDLSYNHLHSSFPSNFGNLKQLEFLDVHDNQLSGTLPSNFGNLSKLKDLHVNDNLLSGELPESVLEGLRSLETLEISGNLQNLVLDTSSQWIPSFQMLSLTMDSVFIGTEFPPWLQTQRNLVKLTMKNTALFGAIPDWFLTAFPNLTSIDLSNNFFTGPIPDQCQTVFPNINSIDLSNNLLTGPIPDMCVVAFPRLDAIDLSDNWLTGSVPTFGAPFYTEHLLLSGNQFSGNIPQELCNLTFLMTLSLGNNHLMGTIPPCLEALGSLEVLELGNNSLSGLIPHELGSLPYLIFLHLNGNRLFGELPASLQNLTLLVTLDFGDNELQGFVPRWIGTNMTSLRYLRLESNNFSGEIPVSLCQLPYLQILNLATNNLVGVIPPCLGNLSSMSSDSPEGSSTTTMAYSDTLLNHIKGIQREYSSSLPFAKFISLSSNYLHGEIPVELMNLKELQSLNLSNNALTGGISQRIDNLSNLESLDLSMNQLSGTIPTSLANIDSLSYLNLSFNNLDGKVPSGNHFDTLKDPSIYKGNAGLCGKVLMKNCPGDDSETPNQPNQPVFDDDDGFDHLSWLYAGIGPGFAVGFLGVICILYFKHPWRIAYFGFVDNVYNKVWVTVSIKISELRGRFN